MEGRVRGTVLNAYFKFVNKKWGKKGLNQCLRSIGLDDEIKDGLYYHYEFSENILRWISREQGPKYTVEVGRFIVKNLGLLKWMVRFSNVQTVAERFPENYSEVYTFGRVETEIVGEHKILIRLIDVNRIKESCNAWRGVCQGALELTKTKGTVTETKCSRKGDPYCEYTIEY